MKIPNGLMTAVGSLFGIGYLAGLSGTYASAVTAGLLLAAFYLGAPLWAAAAAAAAAVAVGIPVAGWFERRLGRKDPRPFVLDELAGMLIAGLAAYLATGVPAWASVAAALVWFRVCDILKPPPVRQIERLPGGWGVVLDDVVAGAMALGLALATMWMFRLAIG
ncbi:MAG TPA: phosphatidylglycerophosphatase A [Phycisphaerae bacterium]|nr:phosphatidylglycerophosphatase A [Phycisphaerae bacterium]